MEGRLFAQERKEKQGKRQAKGTHHVLRISSTRYSSNTQNSKNLNCQNEVEKLSDLLDRELNKTDALFHLKTDLFSKAFLWNILDQESIEESLIFLSMKTKWENIQWDERDHPNDSWVMQWFGLFINCFTGFFQNDFFPSPSKSTGCEHYKK